MTLWTGSEAAVFDTSAM